MRPTRAEVDLDAIRANARALATLVAPSAVLAVVKADAYGHGAVPVSRAALEGGASWLGVALVEEAEELRAAAIDAPVLLLSEQPRASLDRLVALGLVATVYSAEGIVALDEAAGRAGTTVDVHLKVDTGMHRVGAAPGEVIERARAVEAASHLRLAGVFTHLAVADEPDDPYTAGQLESFEEVRAALAAAGFEPPLCHAANSAGAIAHPSSRYDLVRAGIALYGVAPGPELAGAIELVPALRLVSTVSFVKEVPAGTRVSYGLAWEAPARTTLATVPIGYADGVPRRLGAVGGEVLVGGRRCPIAGNVTMDQIVVDVGSAGPVAVGDEVVLLGTQGDEQVLAEEWAGRLGTIGYEIVTRIGPRVPRIHRGVR